MMRLVLLGSVALRMIAGELTQGERDRSMSHLHATRKMLLDAVAGLSDAQWNWKPAADRWSAAEITEHLALAEETIQGRVKLALRESATPETKSAIQDEQLLKQLVDRSRKFQAPEIIRPTGRWKTRREVVEAFKASRDRSIEYVRTTTEDMRSHFAPHPVFGLMDSYQWTLLLAGHAERHILQMREVMTDSGFPKQ